MLLALYLGIILFTATPACQRWLAGKASDVLSEQLKTKVNIGNARIGLFNRIVLDDALICDLEGDTLLSAARISSKIDVLQLLKGRIRIENVQLFGYDINLRKRTKDGPYNFQFIIDSFASQDTTSTPLDLAISNIVIRRGVLSHDLDYEPESDHFSIAHFQLDDLSLEASLDKLTNDDISVDIKKLSLVESRSGLRLDNLKATFMADKYEARLKDAEIRLPNTELKLSAKLNNRAVGGWKLDDRMLAALLIEGRLMPTDLAPLFPEANLLSQPVDIAADATLHQRRFTLSQFEVATDGFNLSTKAIGHVNTKDTLLAMPFDDILVSIKQFNASNEFYAPLLSKLSSEQYKKVLKPDLASMLARFGDISLEGVVQADNHTRRSEADINLKTSIGDVIAQGNVTGEDQFQLTATTNDFRLAELLSENKDFPVDHLTIETDLAGSLKNGSAKGNVKSDGLTIKGTQIDHIDADLDFSARSVQAMVKLTDDQYECAFNANLTSTQNITFDTKGLNQLQGFVKLDDLQVKSGEHKYFLDNMYIALANDDHGHHMLVRGDFIDAHADGRFNYSTIVPTAQAMLHKSMPSLIPEPKTSLQPTDDHIDFSVNLWDTKALQQFADLDIDLLEPGYIEGSVDGKKQKMTVKADLPHVIYGAENLRAASLVFNQEHDSLTTFLTLQRMMATGPLDLSFSADAKNDELHSVFNWDDHNLPALKGSLSTASHFSKDDHGKFGANIKLLPSQVIVSDTIWNVMPAQVNIHDKIVDVHDFQVSQLGRHLIVNGRISKDNADTLYADLRGINLQYIFGLIDFHDVELAGLATGSVKAHNFFDDIAVDADLRVDNFTLNDGLLGTVYVTGGFGRKDERAIDLDAFIHEPIHKEISHVIGLIKPGHEEGRGMTLDIQARYLNTYFINYFTEGIFTDFKGQVTGHANLHGPFKQLDLEGDLAVDTLSTTIDVLGTHYHLLGGDSIHLYPGGIRFRDVKIYDRYHRLGTSDHYADMDGELRFQHFKNMEYDFNITAHNFLGYDFRDFGDQTFYGTVFANGNVKLSGVPGQLNVDINCRPTSGTVFTYNVSTPDATTENEFITFVNKEEGARQASVGGQSGLSGSSNDNSNENTGDDEPNDMHINFDLDITPDAQLRLLMDPRSEDYITLFGNGHIRANFYNKGRFQMYGTYRVDHGTYRLSLQDVIRKDFQFQQGSTITFGGDPMKGDLNLQAVYTVPSVSLNDLSVGNNFSASNVRVNCIMNIGGRAEQPNVSFDFDIPNVNEDEKQMVRSLISTEEERNLQVIYLLGIGRFYTYGLADQQSQANSAVQSLLSSTLSGQFNNFLSNAIGNSNWNFGTNFTTNTYGFNDVDVEGSLSGRLLNNRLLINGTFGYRDTPIANTNFIGDFDVQWLLTKSGNLSLRAYSETNDRYFTKTALTTQGIGLQVKKDFNNLRELFRPRQ